jgi:hypothetical protein
MSANRTATAEKPVVGKKQRSPKHPFIPIDDAITRLRQIYQADRRAWTTYQAVLEHFGYSATAETGRSGTSGRTVAALGHYGLLDDENGQFRVSDLGFRILNLPDDSPERAQLVREAAMKPPIFKKVLTHYTGELPSDTALKSHLVLNEGFNPDSVDRFIRVFRRTIEVANPSLSEYSAGEDSNGNDESPQGGRPMPPATAQSTERRGHPYGPTLEVHRAMGANIPVSESRSFTEAIDQRISDDCRVKVLFEGPVTQEAIQKLIKYLELGLDDYPTKKTVARRPGIWRNKDVDQPVTVLGEAGITDGRRYVKIEGSDTAIPEDEISYTA